TRVRPSCSVNVAVSTEMCPAIGSHSNVWTTRSGATISRYSPRKADSRPSGSRTTYRQLPPGRTSILSTVVVYSRGPHHRGMRSGSIIALNTRSRGASNSLVIRISRSDGSVTFVLAVLLAVAISFLLVFSFEVAKDIVELIEALVPRAAIRLQPRVELPEGLGAKAVDALLRDGMRLHEPGLAEHAEVLRDLGLAQAESFDDLSDRAWLPPEEVDDLPAVWFGESAQRGLHGTYILLQEYSRQGIYSSREYRRKE